MQHFNSKSSDNFYKITLLKTGGAVLLLFLIAYSIARWVRLAYPYKVIY